MSTAAGGGAEASTPEMNTAAAIGVEWWAELMALL